MPVILRWLLMDLVASRVLRRYRMRRYGVDSPMLMGQYPRRYRVPATLFFRRPLLGCGTGCLTMLGLSVLASLLFSALVNTILR